ncbi:MAG: DMT family transporter [Flavobacteriaceae bacterium]|jgi:drug/metabolite transporter (DMT)-like permease|nr:DMT family transporter [Flavobacteriaceae bacterium]MBT4113942.1 DMT family transporter [Flavobacteriaceae bacterium]MBT4613858.1 DMT family transporter [Flavobacteriaceae bacterium]MBT5246425.1 DMT family transporter [Flavobacteriaceae bacterium]MBT5650770.1 DMT family transporter [Flavobacteriaceae bacterium]
MKKWTYLISLSLIWGTSFILIKKALIGLTPLQLGSLRIIFSSIILFIFAWNTLKLITKKEWKWIIISAFLGSFFPAFLFAFAETEIDSSIASILNSLVPLNTVIIGAIVFKIASSKKQIIGVVVGLIGTYLLIDGGIQLNPDQNYLYAGLVILCSFLYGFNVNIIKKYLNDIPAVTIAAGHFSVIFIPAIIIFSFSGFNTDQIYDPITLKSIGYVLVLSVFGTALAKVLFNKLVQISTAVFASSVTYSLLIVSLFWGILDGELFSINQLMATVLIVLGVLLSSRSPRQSLD